MPVDPFTIAAQAGGTHQTADGLDSGIVPAMQPSTTFRRGPGLTEEFIYRRYGHPGAVTVEETATQLDGGAGALVFSSGMAALSAVLDSVPMGGHVVAPMVMYHGGQDWMRAQADIGRIVLTLFNSDDPGGLEQALTEATDLLWLETPTNPLWGLIDIAAATELGHAAGATVVVDSTVAPPVTTRPLALGADLVFHSATKYYNGHSDVLAGILITKVLDDRWQHIETIRGSHGSILGAFDAWLLLRGLRTMPLRYTRSCESAAAIAAVFEHHPQVERVLYPGLASHPGHDIAARQMTGGFGGMLSILVKGGSTQALRVAESTRLFANATSLGGVESLIEHRASYQSTPVPENLLRISVGIEDPDELIADLGQALSG